MTVLDEKYLMLRECQISSHDPSLSSDDDDYSRVTTKKLFSQKFELELTTKKFNDLELANELDTILMGLQGTHGTLTVRNPRWKELPPLEFSEIRTRSDISQLSTVAPCENFTPNLSGALKIGSYIKFEGYPKVYRIQNTVNANGSGQSSINIYPYCYQSIPAGTRVLYGEDVYFQCSLTSDTQITDISATDRTIQMLIPVRERA